MSITRDPNVHPARGDRQVRKPDSPYLKQFPVFKPGEVFAKDPGIQIDRVLPRNPEQWKTNYLTVYPSASHTYGNALSSIEQYIIDIFPSGLFKSINTAMSSSNKQLRSTPSQLVKKRFPMLVSKARIDYGQDGNRALGNSLLTDRMSDIQMSWGLGNLQSFMNDRVYNYKLEWFLNRWVMNIDFILAFNTINEQINWMNYLINSTKINHPFIVTRPLESLIPLPLIEEISRIVGIPVYENDCVGQFLQYMNSVSDYPITYKLKSGSGNDEFFRYYMADMDVTISNPECDEGQRSSQTMRLYEISFSVRVEFNGVGYYFLTSPDIIFKSDKPIMPENDNTAIVCHYTDDINYRLLDIPPGWSLLATPSVRFSSYEDNTVSLRPVLDETLNRMIQFFLDNRMDPGLFLDIEFRCRSQVINLKTPWRIDWKNRLLILDDVDLHETYRLLILVNMGMIHNYEKMAWGVK